MKIENIHVIKDTLRILDDGKYYMNGHAVNLKLSHSERQEARVLLPDEVDAIRWKPLPQESFHKGECQISCENEDSFTAARRHAANLAAAGKTDARVLVLNFASPVAPGGNVRRGASAQEEDLCRCSSLLQSLESTAARPFYDYHIKQDSIMASEAMILSPNVEIIRDENGGFLADSTVVSVLTCAAPNVHNGLEGMSEDDYLHLFYRRIVSILRVANELGYRDLVLGAFGCGAFGNDPQIVSSMFDQALQAAVVCREKDGRIEEYSLFDRVDFAVLDHSRSEENFSSFFSHFGPKTVFFWNEYQQNGFLSNWYERSFELKGKTWFCVEQYFMAEKASRFADWNVYDKILSASTQKECRQLGREVRNFMTPIWEQDREKPMKDGMRAKFEQNPDLREKLLATGDAIIAEASPFDEIWGIGLTAREARRCMPENWKGENLAGKLLMELREEFRGNN